MINKLLAWLSPSPEQRVARARRYLEQGYPDEARLELLEVDHPDAGSVLATAEMQLCERNLKAALEYGQAGDDDRVRVHLELAERFHHGGLEEAFKDTRRELREIRAARAVDQEREKEKAQAKLLSAEGGPDWLDGNPDNVFEDADREEAEQRVALLVENYPEGLRKGIRELGGGFVAAVLALEDGRVEEALQGLMALPDDAPLVLWERARAAHALGDPAAAARAVRSFATHAPGHHRMGRMHSGTYLAQLLAESGEPKAGLTVLREVRRSAPDEGGFLFAQLLMVEGELEQAEKITRELIRKSPKAMPFYGLLARVRLRGGHRPEAMRALEAGFEATHCKPGSCGHQAPDLDAHRLLATLYLEDGVEVERGLELADAAAALVRQPTVEDVYLRTLVAKSRGEPGMSNMAQQLAGQLSDSDPRRERLLALVE